MSSERASVTGIVVLTICVTSGVIAGGWFAASQYLGPQAVGAPHEDASAVPAPRKKAPRASATGKGRGGTKSNGASNDATPVGAPEVSDSDSLLVPDDNEASSLAEGSAPDRSDSADAPLEGTTPPADNHRDARTIMEEAQRRAEARSYRYDGVLQSFDGNGKVAEKRWRFDRLGSRGQSKAVLRFTAPPEVKGVALLIENHPERASDQWMWTRPSRETPSCVTGSINPVLWNRFQLRGSRGARRRPIRLCHARRRDGRGSRLLEDSDDAEEKPVGVFALDCLDPEGQLRVRTA